MKNLSTGVKISPEEEEEACKKYFTRNAVVKRNGRSQVCLTLKKSPELLENSFEMAWTYFLSVERSFDRDLQLKNMYIKFMDNNH